MSTTNTSTRKLTKKQKKGLAFRQRKDKKESKDLLEELAVPEVDLVHDEEPEPQAKASPKPRLAILDTTSKKRKREIKESTTSQTGKEGGTGASEAPKKQKKRKLENGVAAVEDAEEPASEKEADDTVEKTRYILFVGNLKYTTPVEAIREHFSKCDPPPKIRLLTPKPKAPGATTPKSKGCAFLEFSHKNALQQGLKLHGSNLDGRRINVELTAGGGGKSEQRVKKLQARNKQLLEERKTRVQKKIEAGDEVDTDVIARPQRHSTTSGMENVPLSRRTWSVPEAEEESGRGGAKKRGKKKPPKNWGTGANSIAVG